MAEKDDPLEGFVMQPEPSEIDRAAAIIAGHDKIMAMGTEGMTNFHGFVQEVLATTVEPELERLRRELAAAISAVRRWHVTALAMRDMSITGEGDIQDTYFDAAMSIPFYGVATEPQNQPEKVQSPS